MQQAVTDLFWLRVAAGAATILMVVLTTQSLNFQAALNERLTQLCGPQGAEVDTTMPIATCERVWEAVGSARYAVWGDPNP